MLKLVLKRISTFTAAVVFGFALLMLDTDSPTLISEAHACSQEVYETCMFECGIACISGGIWECDPWNGCSCQGYCHAICAAWAGC